MNPIVGAAFSRKLALILGVSVFASVYVGRWVSEYALAASMPEAKESRNPSSLPIQVIGTYTVREIIQSSGQYRGSVCVPHSPKRGIRFAPDENCGRRLWIVRQGKEVAVVQQPSAGQSGTVQSFLTPSDLFNARCALEAKVTRRDARAIFESPLCRAAFKASDKRASRFRAPSDQVFYLYESQVPGRFSAYQRVVIPRGSESPESIRVEERGRGGALLNPTTIQRTYHLEKERRAES